MTKPEHVGGDRYRVRRRIGGKQRSRYFHASSKSAANRAAAKHLAELDAEADRWQARQGTIAHLIDDWKAVTWPDRSPSTIRGYKGHVRLILDEFGRRQAATLTHRELTAWYGKLRADGKARVPSSTCTPRSRPSCDSVSAIGIYPAHRPKSRWCPCIVRQR